MKCPKCGSRDIDFLEAGGQSICVSCGTVVEESTIVSSIEFQETGDRSHVIGQYVSATCSKPYMAGSRLMGRHMDVRDGKEASLLNARRTITQVASTLRLPPLYIDRAYRLYQLALQRNFTFGRRQTHVVATCLYIICRQEKSPHLLIDFSDALQVNVYVLGKAFLQFSRVLNLNLPVVDPSLYIHRYAGKLDFGDKMNSVVTTTLRIVTRLKKDWIAMGRRPDGVCAAALLIASRAHDFNISQENISVLFRIAQDTLRRRLVEFKNTPSAQLNLQQFHTHDTEVEFDPPSFINNTLAEYGDNINLNMEDNTVTEDAIKVAELIDDDVYKTISDSEDENDDESTGMRSSSQRDSMNTRYKVVNLGNDIKVNVPLPTLRKSRKESAGHRSRQDERLVLYDEIYSEVYESTMDKNNQIALVIEAQDIEQNPQNTGGWGVTRKGRKNDNKLTINVDVGSKSNIFKDLEEVDEEIVPLTEAEASTYLLSQEESSKRAAIWDKTYGPFMEERARRKREREKTSDGQNTDKYTQGGKLRKKYTRKVNNHSNASDAAMSSRSTVKGASKKINYDALKGVFGGDGAFAVPETSTDKARSSTGAVAISKPSDSKDAPKVATAAVAPKATTETKPAQPAAGQDEFYDEEEEEEEILMYEDDGNEDFDDEYY